MLDTHKVEGVYRYDEDTGELTVECLFAGNPVSFTGRAKHADGVLTLLFEANAALGSLRASSQQYAQNPKLQQIAAILERYPGVMLGAFESADPSRIVFRDVIRRPVRSRRPTSRCRNCR